VAEGVSVESERELAYDADRELGPERVGEDVVVTLLAHRALGEDRQRAWRERSGARPAPRFRDFFVVAIGVRAFDDELCERNLR